MVEAAGQLVLLFRTGLDYTFILLPGCGACYSRHVIALNPSAGSTRRFSRSMSLYRAGLELASFLPLGIAVAEYPP